MSVYVVPQHKGELGKSYSLLKVEGNGKVMVNAVKLAENSDELIVRVKELAGHPAENMSILFDRPIVSVREVNGQEEEISAMKADGKALKFSLTRYQPKAFAVKLESPKESGVMALVSQPVSLPYDLDGISLDADKTDGNIDGLGNSLTGELLPHELTYQNVKFDFGPTGAGAKNVVSCNGQELSLPPIEESTPRELYLLMLATDGPAQGSLKVIGKNAEQSFPVSLYDYTEPMGQWNNRMVNGQMVTHADEILPSYINHTPVVWAGTHRHNADGNNDIYTLTYLYAQHFPLTAEARSVVLPDNPRMKLLAATVVGNQYDVIRPASAHYDEAAASLARIHAEEPIFIDSTSVSMSSPMPGAVVHYTLDGSDPEMTSPVFSTPLRLKKSTTIRARAFDGTNTGGVVTNLSVQKLIPRDAVSANNLKAGLQCSYYEGEWRRLPDFDSLKAVQTLVMDSVVIPELTQPEDYALVFKGFVKVPTDGLYEFGISSDDGSALYVADSLVADNDGIHGDGEIAGKIALKAGMHPIEARMFQCKGGQALRLYITGPGLERQAVTKEMLFH